MWRTLARKFPEMDRAGLREGLNLIEQERGPQGLREAWVVIRTYETARPSFARDGMIDLVRTCRRRDQELAVVTANSLATAEAALCQFGIAECFARIIAGDLVSRRKPDPEGLATAIRSLNVDLNEACYVADGDHEVRAARELGVDLFEIITQTWHPVPRDL